MNTAEISKRLEAMERRADATQTVARILLSQVERQRREIASLKEQCSAERMEAPSLAAMLRTLPAKPR
jgi:hypothetical protein